MNSRPRGAWTIAAIGAIAVAIAIGAVVTAGNDDRDESDTDNDVVYAIEGFTGTAM